MSITLNLPRSDSVKSPRPHNGDRPLETITIKDCSGQTFLPGQQPEPEPVQAELFETSIDHYDLRCGDCDGYECAGTDYEGDFDHCPLMAAALTLRGRYGDDTP